MLFSRGHVLQNVGSNCGNIIFSPQPFFIANFIKLHSFYFFVALENNPFYEYIRITTCIIDVWIGSKSYSEII